MVADSGRLWQVRVAIVAGAGWLGGWVQLVGKIE